MDEERLMKQLKQYYRDFVNRVDPIQILPYLPCLTPASKNNVDIHQSLQLTELIQPQRIYAEVIRARQDNKGKRDAAQELYSHLEKFQERGIKELLVALRNEDIGLEDLADRIDPPSTKDNTDSMALNLLLKLKQNNDFQTV